jgi:hypothetical protein
MLLCVGFYPLQSAPFISFMMDLPGCPIIALLVLSLQNDLGLSLREMNEFCIMKDYRKL